MTFEQTPEYKQSILMRDACDNVLCSAFNIPKTNITRYEHGTDLFILDQQFAIDLSVKLNNGTTLTGQEKALSNKFYTYKTFTVEFYQNRYTKEKGEFFKIASQFYLHGYSDESGIDFIDWKIIDILKFIDWLKEYGEDALSKKTRPAGGSNAAFLPIPYNSIPDEFILYKKNISL